MDMDNWEGWRREIGCWKSGNTLSGGPKHFKIIQMHFRKLKLGIAQQPLDLADQWSRSNQWIESADYISGGKIDVDSMHKTIVISDSMWTIDCAHRSTAYITSLYHSRWRPKG